MLTALISIAIITGSVITVILLANARDDHRTVTPMWIGAPVIEHDTVHVRMSFRTPHEDAAGMQ